MSDKRERVTRRQVLVGTGAMAAAFGTVALSSCKARTTGKWDQEVDIVVVGSGVGACTAAVVAHEIGDSALVVEKASTVGGTSAKSAGVLWIPNNFTLKERGIEDEKSDCVKYMARFTYPEQYSATVPNLGLSSFQLALLEAFYDNASDAVDALRDYGALNLAEWRMFALDRPATDYLDHVPENKVPVLGSHKPMLPGECPGRCNTSKTRLPMSIVSPSSTNQVGAAGRVLKLAGS